MDVSLLSFLQADQTVTVEVDLAEQLLAEEELLARDEAVAVAVHLLEPHRADCRAGRVGAVIGRGVAVEQGRRTAEGGRGDRAAPQRQLVVARNVLTSE